ncbi:MAG: HAD-IA family hydrolase [Armatimonadota bacterium]|nr:HAD-IA family hydrolase [Armatimonadota bacterium]
MTVSARRIRGVFFDAGNTLIRMEYRAIAGALAAHGVQVSPSDVQRAEWRARVRLDASLAPGASTEHADTGARYLAYVLEELGVRDPVVRLALDAWRRAYNPPVGLWTDVEPEAAAALELARGAGLRVAVISNSNGSVRGILEEVGLARHLEFVIDSSEVGVEKPDPRIFTIALDRAGLAPAEAAYVGDLYSVDVVGARVAGLEARGRRPGRLILARAPPSTARSWRPSACRSRQAGAPPAWPSPRPSVAISQALVGLGGDGMRPQGSPAELDVAGPEAVGYRTSLWTCRRIVDLIRHHFGVVYHPDHVGRLLRACGLSPQRPQPRPKERSDHRGREWIQGDWAAVKKTAPARRPPRLRR